MFPLLLVAVISSCAAVALLLTLGQLRFVRYYSYKGLATPWGPLEWFTYHLRELGAAGTLGLWYARGALGALRREPLRQTVCSPVLCIHGWTQNPTNWIGLRTHLEHLGRPTQTVFLGLPPRSIEAYARRLEDTLRDLTTRYPTGVDLVAHSMGGIVLRLVLHQNPELGTGVRRVITLGSPHRGTAGARGLHFIREAAELARTSSLIEGLPDFRALIPQAEVTTIAALRDLLVYPSSTCHMPGTRAIDLERVGHCGLLTHPSCIRLVGATLTSDVGR